MRISGTLCCATIVVALAAAPNALAQDTTYTWTGNVNDRWDEPGNWSPNNGLYPGAADKAIIQGLGLVKVVEAEEVGILQVDSGGELLICKGGKLTMWRKDGIDSTIDGHLIFAACIDTTGCDAMVELEIAEDLKITGDGGIIVAHACITEFGQNVVKGKITSRVTGGTPALLTLETDPSGSNDFVIRGHIDIQAKLVNNASIGVQDATDILFLSTNSKSGDTADGGEWFATAGKLQVDVTVTGDAPWDATGSDTEVEFNAAIANIGGDVAVANEALLDINADFCTTGQLTYSGPVSAQVTTITVASAKDASFSGSCSTP